MAAQEIHCTDRFVPSQGMIRQQLLQQLNLRDTAQIQVRWLATRGHAGEGVTGHLLPGKHGGFQCLEGSEGWL